MGIKIRRPTEDEIKAAVVPHGVEVEPGYAVAFDDSADPCPVLNVRMPWVVWWDRGDRWDPLDAFETLTDALDAIERGGGR